jgi:hypothetical protein
MMAAGRKIGMAALSHRVIILPHWQASNPP